MKNQKSILFTLLLLASILILNFDNAHAQDFNQDAVVQVTNESKLNVKMELDSEAK